MRGPRRSRSASSISTTATLQALHDINMSLADRSITAFIGPSGCGKSTLLRVLNRMYALYPNQRAEGRGADRRPGHSGPRGRRRGTALPGRHGVSKAHAVPDVGVRERRLRPAPRGRDARRRSARCGWSRRSRMRRSGTRSRTNCTPTDAACRADSSSGCASRGRSPCSPRCCCSTSPPRRSTRSRR